MPRRLVLVDEEEIELPVPMIMSSSMTKGSFSFFVITDVAL